MHALPGPLASERSQHAQGLGAEALMILRPYLEGPEEDDRLFAFHEAIDATVEPFEAALEHTDSVASRTPQSRVEM